MISDMAVNVETFRRRLEAAARRSGRPVEDVAVVAVTKSVPPERLRDAVHLGLTVFGENKIQEALPKIEALKGVPGLEWHFIGHLQSNKAARAAEHFKLIQSVDSIDLASFLNRKALGLEKMVDVLCEVKLSPETTKFGLPLEEFEPFLEACENFERLRVRGVMAMAPFTRDQEAVRRVFRRARELWEAHLLNFCGQPVLSMGMSDDFEIAVEEGSTMVRIGRALFGPREKTA